MKPALSRFLVLSLASCLVLVAGDRIAGFTYFELGGVGVVWPGSQSLRFLSPTTFPPESVVESHMLGAMALWNIVPAADFEYSASRLEQDLPIDHTDGFSDTAAVPAAQLDPGVLGVTFMVNSGADWFDMDILFSDNPLGVGYTFDPTPSCEVISNPLTTDGFSFALIAVHELGHGLGLGHAPVGDEAPGTPWFIATMNPAYPSGGPVGQENIIEVHTDDRSGLRFLYPPSGVPETLVDLAQPGYSTGSNLGMAVPVFFGPTTVVPGEQVTARSVVENFGTTDEVSVRQGFYLSSDAITATDDLFLGAIEWDMPFGDGFEFDVDIEIPDMAPGTYFLGSILDDLDEVIEEFEDNNAVTYCEPLTVGQLSPIVDPLGQQVAVCAQAFTGPTPTVTHPLNMQPITWRLVGQPSGMIVDPTTGVISWEEPVPSSFPYAITVVATNDAGTSSQTLFLGVERVAPQVEAVADETASCGTAYTGPAPVLTLPECMEPVFNWSLDVGPAGMTIHPGSGVVTWPSPSPSPVPHTVTIRATNAIGNGSVTWQLQVSSGDLDGDGEVSIADLPDFATCLAGPGTDPGDECTCADADSDGDVDLIDVGVLQNSFSQ